MEEESTVTWKVFVCMSLEVLRLRGLASRSSISPTVTLHDIVVDTPGKGLLAALPVWPGPYSDSQ